MASKKAMAVVVRVKASYENFDGKMDIITEMGPEISQKCKSSQGMNIKTRCHLKGSHSVIVMLNNQTTAIMI